MTFSATEKSEEAAREAKMREQVFARRVAQGQMTADRAAKLTAIMWEIAMDYAELAKKERLL